MSTRGWYQRLSNPNPGVVDVAFVRSFERWVGPWVRIWFRPRLVGVENLPTNGAYMLVGNHSGVGIAEVFCLALLWWRTFGSSRPLAGFAHPLAFRMPLLRTGVRGLGVVPSTHDAADRALESGVPLMIFPGGDHEAFRPIWQARRVDFAGRKGFLRIAQRHAVPIVPMAITGSHVTIPILWRSHLLAWLLVWPRLAGIKRLPVQLLGIVICVLAFFAGRRAGGPWVGALCAWASWTLIPSVFFAFVPSRITLTILPPIDPPKREDELDDAYARVTGVIQAAMDGGEGS